MGVRMQTAPAPSAESVADSPEKLAALRDRGILTAEEFDEQKGKLLGKCPLVIATSVIPEVPLTAEDAEELPTEARSRMMAAMDRAIQTAAIVPKETVRTLGKRNGV